MHERRPDELPAVRYGPRCVSTSQCSSPSYARRSARLLVVQRCRHDDVPYQPLFAFYLPGDASQFGELTFGGGELVYVRIAQHNSLTPFESLSDGDLVSEPVSAFHLPWVPRKWAGWRSKTLVPRQLAWKGKCEPAWRAGVVSLLRCDFRRYRRWGLVFQRTDRRLLKSYLACPQIVRELSFWWPEYFLICHCRSPGN